MGGEWVGRRQDSRVGSVSPPEERRVGITCGSAAADFTPNGQSVELGYIVRTDDCGENVEPVWCHGRWV